MTALTLASLITLSSNAKGYIHPCGFGPHWFAFMKALSPFLWRLPSLCSHRVSSAFHGEHWVKFCWIASWDILPLGKSWGIRVIVR